MSTHHPSQYIPTPRGWSLPLTMEDGRALASRPTEEFHRAWDCVEAERADVGYLLVADTYGYVWAGRHSRLRGAARRLALANIGIVGV